MPPQSPLCESLRWDQARRDVRGPPAQRLQKTRQHLGAVRCRSRRTTRFYTVVSLSDFITGMTINGSGELVKSTSKGFQEMRKSQIALTTAAALTLCGSMVWAAHATSLMNTAGSLPRAFSPVEKIGCTRAGSNCPKGYQLDRYGERCIPCGGGYYEPRRYRDYDYYEPRRRRDYDDQYAPRRYPREYY
jgi:hypothetical protein